MLYIWSLIIISLIISLLLVFTLDKSNLFKGGFINLSLLIVMFILYMFVVKTESYWLTIILTLIALFIFLTLPIVTLIFIGSLIYLGWMLVTKEGTSYTNFLSIGLGIVLFIYLVLNFVMKSSQDQLVLLAAKLFSTIVTYYIVHISAFVTTFIYITYKRKKGAAAYIIVLGSGLVNNKVPPLLQSRINKGLKLSQRYPVAKVIFSGGQGTNESIAEGEAMKNYAV